eukprot:1413176-Pleurochrysis_carterae.AAC.1
MNHALDVALKGASRDGARANAALVARNKYYDKLKTLEEEVQKESTARRAFDEKVQGLEMQ